MFIFSPEQLSCFLPSADFFRFFNSLSYTIRVSYSLNPDQARPFVGPDLGPNCLQRYQQTTLVDKELI